MLLKRKYMVFLLQCFLSTSFTAASGKVKRQLFRENLLPHYGGKIPDSAFLPERIALNRLNQNGLYSLDGEYLQQRIPNFYQSTKPFIPETIKIDKDGIIDTSYVIIAPITNYVNFPLTLPQIYQLPLIPRTSLNLIERHKIIFKENNYNKGDSYHSSSSPQQILSEYKPLLQKLHDANYI